MCEPLSSDSECLFSQDDRSTLDGHFIPSAQSSSDEEYSSADQSLRDLMEANENLAAGEILSSAAAADDLNVVNGGEQVDSHTGGGDETR